MTGMKRTTEKNLMVFSGRAHPQLAEEVTQLLGTALVPQSAYEFANSEIYVRYEESVRGCDAFVLDFHAETTSEKMAMGHFCDGRASAVVGTHSHVPTADFRILEKGTAYMTDIGMCGDYDSVIGMRKENSIARFVTKLPGERLEVADGEATLCAALVETDDASGLARSIAPLRLGGKLAPHWPAPARAVAAAE